MHNQQEDNNMEKVGNQCMTMNDGIMDMLLREAVRMMDAMESENGYLCENSVENYELIEKEARNKFPNGLSATVLKFSSGLNMHGKGECQIKESVEDDSCPRCIEPEDWNHVIQCSCIESKRNECLGRLIKKLNKANSNKAC